MTNRLLQFWNKVSLFNSNVVNTKILEFKQATDIVYFQNVGLFGKTEMSLNV